MERPLVVKLLIEHGRNEDEKHEKMQLMFWRAAGTYLAFVLAMILLLFILAYAGVMSVADF